MVRNVASEPPVPTFEQAVSELERILRSLEDGKTSLEEGLAEYERGVHLLRSCHEQLTSAEQKIYLLSSVDTEGKPNLQAFDHSASAEVPGEEKRRGPSGAGVTGPIPPRRTLLGGNGGGEKPSGY